MDATGPVSRSGRRSRTDSMVLPPYVKAGIRRENLIGDNAAACVPRFTVSSWLRTALCRPSSCGDGHFVRARLARRTPASELPGTETARAANSNAASSVGRCIGANGPFVARHRSFAQRTSSA